MKSTVALVLVLSLLAASFAAEAQQTGKVWRIGWLSPPSAATGLSELDPLISSYRALIVDFATGHRLISMYGDREYVKGGGLMFYGTSTTDMWHQAAI